MDSLDIPLCVDLDGTLTRANTLHESALALVRQSPAALFWLPFWLLSGIATVKREIALRAGLDTSCLPLNGELLDWLKRERATGRRMVLATVVDAAIAKRIAAQLGLFDEVISSDTARNLTAENKRAELVARFGERGFDYVGNKRADEPIWRSARRAIVVGSSCQIERARSITEIERSFAASEPSRLVWVKAVRLHQWVKNLLVFLPAVLAHQVFQPTVFGKCLLAFIAFGACASSVYIFNDLLDLPSDRQHPRKVRRPFASGELPASTGALVALLLFICSAVLAFYVSWKFEVVLAAYYVLTWAYSLRLKRIALVDVMTLAGLYTARIIAGSAATSIHLSFWLLAFAVFIFLSLGFVKRYTELEESRQANNISSHGRGYRASDLPLLMSLGVSAGYSTIVVVALYINSPESQALYHHHKPLWLVCPLLLFWISRVWLLTTRGNMHDDPVVFAVRDPTSLLVAVLVGAIVAFCV